MADTNEILGAAHRLGQMVGTHPAISAYRDLTRQLDLDVGARDLLARFEQLMEHLAAKEANMQPIEIAEKQQAQQLQQSISIHPLLKKLMTAQMEYMDLMRKVQDSINGGLSGQAAPAGQANLQGQPGAQGEQPPAQNPASKIILE